MTGAVVPLCVVTPKMLPIQVVSSTFAPPTPKPIQTTLLAVVTLPPDVSADGDIGVTAVGIVCECTATDRNIAFTGGIVKERFPPDCCIVAAFGVIERAHSRPTAVLATPSRTASKSVAPDSCVVVTCGVGSQCKPCICCVAEAGGVVQERSQHLWRYFRLRY